MIRKTHDIDSTEEWLINCTKHEFEDLLKKLRLPDSFYV